jgi:hypothetical protein
MKTNLTSKIEFLFPGLYFFLFTAAQKIKILKFYK